MTLYKAQVCINSSTLNSYEFKQYLINAKVNDKGFRASTKFMNNIFISSVYDADNVEMSYGFRTNGSFRTNNIQHSTFHKQFRAWFDIYGILSFYIFYRVIKYISLFQEVKLLTINDKNCLFLLESDITSIIPLIKFIDSNDKSILVNPIEDLINIFEEYPELKQFENPKDIKYLEMLK